MVKRKKTNNDVQNTTQTTTTRATQHEHIKTGVNSGATEHAPLLLLYKSHSHNNVLNDNE